MRKIILKYWIINMLTGVILYVAYRITITDTAAAGDDLLATVLSVLEIALNLAFSLLYLAAIAICSCTVFLNFVKKVRDSYFLSWLSFSGASILLIVLLIISLLIDIHHYGGNIMARLLVFSILYPCITTILFLKFRKSYHVETNTAKTAR